ncbi:DNA-3-methyladenine glycosylase I [Aliiroseovarius crassostreae]|uniref:DNA-3-methyladenine glycosylase I n=1 Tax=Aliiroseovarius crassostreae TaxID=154981 RepID=UPI0021AFEE10|nr:DNA-3-methyladenine glycosylase I [Aliiroseovarius crassostreae]UWQ08879.1 DNA-3-methyladenine glycosylase I [Aliiroseovarius crassostreae]UWQ11961.1 DNA-3-methyladenine glycosylase I [Aliiroseovarius crassostreae]
MRKFDDILMMAVERKGSFEAVLGDVAEPKSTAELAAMDDSAWLACFAKGIFQAGLAWQVIVNKWDGIEEAFHGFDIGRCAMMSDEWFDELLADTRVIRSGPKIRAIQENAVFVQAVSAEAGSFGQKIGDWPSSDYFGLLDWLKSNGSRLGGNTGAYALRMMGRDGFMMTQDVVARLVHEGIIDKAPTSKAAKAAVQAAFNDWAQESGRSFTEISRVLAYSID